MRGRSRSPRHETIRPVCIQQLVSLKSRMQFFDVKSLLLVAIANAFLAQLTYVTGIPLADFYPFGSENDDTAVRRDFEDGSSPRITLSTPFPFFNEGHSTLYVNNNGAISFETSVSQYTPDPFPLGGNRKLIAPYWADVDTRGIGTVWYRETTGDLPTFLNASGQVPSSVLLFVATWDHVGYFNSHTDKTNTFQCILITNGVTSYAAFLYADDEIQWTTGDLSGGSNGLGGTAAHVGFNAGDNINFFNVPGSQTPEIINITNTSNIGIDGVWVFRVDGEEIVPANSDVVFERDLFPEECYSRITLCQQYNTDSNTCSDQLESYFQFGSTTDPLYRVRLNDLAFNLLPFSNGLSTALTIKASVVDYSSNCRQNETQPCVLGSLDEDDVINCTYTAADIFHNEVTIGDCVNGTTELNLDLNGTGLVLFKRETSDCGPSDLLFVISLPEVITPDPCDTLTCVQGTCSRLDNGTYGCECFLNYTGIMCNESVQENSCLSNPCLNGGTCVDLPASSNSSYVCICPTGYTGQLCESDQKVCDELDCFQSQYFQACTDMCVESEAVDQKPCTISLCNSYQFVLDSCNLSCSGAVGATVCDTICNIPTYMDRFNDSCVMELCRDYLDPSSCPFDDIKCEETGSGAISCKSICVSVNIGDVSDDCAQSHANLCRKFLKNITDSDEFDSATADTVVCAAENFEDFLSSSLDYVDILFKYFDNFTEEAISYLQPEATEEILNIFEEYFSDTRIQEWENLQNGSSQNFLQHIETLGNLLAEGRMETLQYNGSNVGLAVEKPNRGNVVEGAYQSSGNSQDLLAMVNIPVDLLCENNRVDEDCSSVSTFVVRNLPMYLEGGGSNRSRTNSILLSTQVLPKRPNFQEQLNDNPIVLEFDQFQVGEGSIPYCAFWDFAIDDFSTINVTTVPQMMGSSRVVCNTRHLTSFAVLVQVRAGEEDFALSVVSYIGCSVSIVCLALTIFLLILLRKKLNKGVLLYVHLNLAIALLIGLAVFVAGIQSATPVPGLCTLVAALLHYFFLCVFCWMLAEGIMLYLLVVKVFGAIAQKWYYLLILGWGVPVPIVVISAAVLHEDYGNSNYCWIIADVSRPAIWLFVGPMLLIIMINTVILILTVASMVRGRKKGGAEQEVKTRTLVKTAIKGTLILLPLLGLTWIFGLFAVDKNTVAFAWLFTIFNSLQGILIFTLHVLRNKHVISKIKRLHTYIYASRPKGSRLSTTTSGTMPDSKNFRLNMKYQANVQTEDVSFENLLATSELSPVSLTSYEKTPLRIGDETKANGNL